MNEKELLTLAARAIGLTGEMQYAGTMLIGLRHAKGIWNPLVYYADTFHLMVTLRIDLEFGQETVTASAFGAPDSEGYCDYPGAVAVDYTSNPYYATCRAITQAAAEIGKAMS